MGTATHVIASVEATESNVGDAVMLAPLLASSVERGFDVRELSADKVYLSNENLVAIEAVHVMPYIPFKSNSKGTGRTDAWRRLWHTFEARNEEALRVGRCGWAVLTLTRSLRKALAHKMRADARAEPMSYALPSGDEAGQTDRIGTYDGRSLDSLHFWVSHASATDAWEARPGFRPRGSGRIRGNGMLRRTLAPVAEHRQDRFVKRSWKAPWEAGAVRDDHVVGWLAETEVPTRTLEIGDWGRVILTPPSPTGDPGDIRIEFEDTTEARQKALTFAQTLYEELGRRSAELCVEFVRASDHYHLLVSDHSMRLARLASDFARTISTGVLGAQGRPARPARSLSTSVAKHVRHRSAED